jgi:hypothetical protein
MKLVTVVLTSLLSMTPLTAFATCELKQDKFESRFRFSVLYALIMKYNDDIIQVTSSNTEAQAYIDELPISVNHKSGSDIRRYLSETLGINYNSYTSEQVLRLTTTRENVTAYQACLTSESTGKLFNVTADSGDSYHKTVRTLWLAGEGDPTKITILFEFWSPDSQYHQLLPVPSGSRNPMSTVLDRNVGQPLTVRALVFERGKQQNYARAFLKDPRLVATLPSRDQPIAVQDVLIPYVPEINFEYRPVAGKQVEILGASSVQDRDGGSAPGSNEYRLGPKLDGADAIDVSSIVAIPTNNSGPYGCLGGQSISFDPTAGFAPTVKTTVTAIPSKDHCPAVVSYSLSIKNVAFTKVVRDQGKIVDSPTIKKLSSMKDKAAALQ